MLNIESALRHSTRLSEVSDTARRDLELLLCHIMQAQRSDLFAHPERELSCAQEDQFLAALARLENREPLALVTGRQGFWNLELEVSPLTLIPRPDTEVLVEFLLQKSRLDAPRILDLGTGTGAIALALGSELKKAEIVGVDIDESIVALARRNAALNGVHNCRFMISNWYAQVKGRFDLIVSNPPYIAEDDEHLDAPELRFEPRRALISARDGLEDIDSIVASAPEFLVEGGRLVVEHGWTQADAVRKIFSERGFVEVETICDYGGRQRACTGVFGQSN